MISLSKLIKPADYITIDNKKIIQSLLDLPHPMAAASAENPDTFTPEEQEELREAGLLKDQILQDAEQLAESRIRQAAEEAEEMKAAASQEIDQWWNERRELDGEAIESAKQQGYEEGYQSGLLQAETEIRAQYERQINESRSLLERAYDTKQQIIRDAEPFLIELSCSIAEKIVQRQLTVAPEWITSITKEILGRKRERGIITLCVSPQQYAQLQAAQDELKQVIDSQAELQIVPDLTVKDQGCVVRSEYGSIDARVQTQLTEIKQALLQLAAAEEGVSDERYA